MNERSSERPFLPIPKVVDNASYEKRFAAREPVVACDPAASSPRARARIGARSVARKAPSGEGDDGDGPPSSARDVTYRFIPGEDGHAREQILKILSSLLEGSP